MPQIYREAYDDDAMSEHARIVHRRRGLPAHAAAWRRFPSGEAAICVVADDRAGLLSLVSAALVVNQLDVASAQAYCRSRSDGIYEAVDLIWVRHPRDGSSSPAVEPEEVARVGELLGELVEGTLDLDTAMRRAARPSGPKTPARTSVRFADGSSTGIAVLVVETEDRPGLLLKITKTLFESRVQIARSDVKTDGGRVFDRFHVVEFDGAPIPPRRRRQIEDRVLAAIESLAPIARS
jgi:UTP:GlnB (protein PII) uridylyltransferase